MHNIGLCVPQFLILFLMWKTQHDKFTSQYTQEALLPQTDRATHYVSRHLVNCRNKLYNKSTTNRSNGVTGLQLIDCSKQPRLIDCRSIGVVNKLDRRRRLRRVLLTSRSTCRGHIFKIWSLEQNPRGKYPSFCR